MLVEKIASSGHLLLVQVAAPLQMPPPGGLLTGHHIRIPLGVIQVLQIREWGTHGATHQEFGTLCIKKSISLVTHFLNVEIPWVALFIFRREVKGNPRDAPEVRVPARRIAHAWCGVYLGHHCPQPPIRFSPVLSAILAESFHQTYDLAVRFTDSGSLLFGHHANHSLELAFLLYHVDVHTTWTVLRVIVVVHLHVIAGFLNRNGHLILFFHALMTDARFKPRNRIQGRHFCSNSAGRRMALGRGCHLARGSTRRRASCRRSWSKLDGDKGHKLGKKWGCISCSRRPRQPTRSGSSIYPPLGCSGSLSCI